MPFLVLQTDSQSNRLQLGETPVSIGRSSDNDLPIAEERASRRHCVVEKIPKGYRLRDLESTNGTRVNGRRIARVKLRPGDEVQISETVILFDDPDAPAPKKKPQRKSAGKRAKHNPLAGAADFELPEDVILEEVRPSDEMFDPTKSTRHEPPVKALARLLQYGHEQALQVGEITLMNARGKVVHGADEIAADDDDDANQTIQLFRLLIAVGFKTKASDIHFEPHAEEGFIRVRIDGTMVDAATIDIGLFRRIMNLTKILCDIDITQRAIVQEGHFSTKVPDRTVDYRISYTPAVHGQKLVIRILDSSSAPERMEDLELPDWMLRDISTVSKQTAGMVLVCGPTGSGKTTTLYSVLRDVDRMQRNVITIEDPVEYQIDGVTHIPCNLDQGNTFNSLLRSVLRQDPDVILLGEIRDAETAQTAMQAAMTGHLVLSTVHAKDTIGTIFRLLDLGVEPFLLGSSLNLILAQRLIRILCDNCKAARRPQPTQFGKMGRAGKDVTAIYYPVGCKKCLNVGYLGRRALFELLTVNDALRDVILNTPTIAAIREALKRTIFTSLEEMGWRLIAEGTASVEEVERIVGTGR